MDNNLSGLDPKLKEAYERVMGTATPSTPPPPQTPQQTPQTAQPSVVKPTLEQTAQAQPSSQPVTPTPASQPQTPEEPTKDEASESTVAYQAFTETNAGTAKKKSGISPIILIFGGIVFFIVYALVWIKLFNVKLPFLP